MLVCALSHPQAFHYALGGIASRAGHRLAFGLSLGVVAVAACFAVAVAGFALAIAIAGTRTGSFIIVNMPARAFENNSGRLEDPTNILGAIRTSADWLVRDFLKLLELMPARITAINVGRHSALVLHDQES